MKNQKTNKKRKVSTKNDNKTKKKKKKKNIKRHFYPVFHVTQEANFFYYGSPTQNQKQNNLNKKHH